jgi:hypothetical protein
MGSGPEGSRAFNSVLPRKAKDTARPAPATALDVLVECYQVKMRVCDVVARLVVNRRNESGFTVCQRFRIGPNKGNPLVCGGLARKGNDEPFSYPTTSLRC